MSITSAHVSLEGPLDPFETQAGPVEDFFNLLNEQVEVDPRLISEPGKHEIIYGKGFNRVQITSSGPGWFGVSIGAKDYHFSQGGPDDVPQFYRHGKMRSGERGWFPIANEEADEIATRAMKAASKSVRTRRSNVVSFK